MHAQTTFSGPKPNTPKKPQITEMPTADASPSARCWPLDRSGVREAAPLRASAVTMTPPLACNIVSSSTRES
jgi:hypothetical protein